MMQTRGVLLLGVAALAVVSVGFGVGFGVVPPSALTGSEGARCVFEAGVAVPVELVASQLGLSLVTSGQALTRVDVAPPGDAACG